jgi:hypothetical protein
MFIQPHQKNGHFAEQLKIAPERMSDNYHWESVDQDLGRDQLFGMSFPRTASGICDRRDPNGIYGHSRLPTPFFPFDKLRTGFDTLVASGAAWGG